MRRVANVKVTEINTGETKSFTLEFRSAWHLIQQIDESVENTTWQKEGNQNFEIVVTHDEHFSEYEYEILRIGGYLVEY